MYSENKKVSEIPKPPEQKDIFDEIDRYADKYLPESPNEALPENETEFAEILQRIDDLEVAWRKEGINGVEDAFISPDGTYIAIGRFVRPEERAQILEKGLPKKMAWDEAQQQTFRILYGDEVRDITIPPEATQESMIFRGKTRAEASRHRWIYNFQQADDDSSLSPDDAEWLRSKFGERLALSGAAQRKNLYTDEIYNDVGYLQGGEGTAAMPSIESIVRRQKDKIDVLHEEATRIENQARDIGAKVLRHWYEPKSRFHRRREKAYRDEIHRLVPPQ